MAFTTLQRIYVASSWHWLAHDDVIAALRDAGFTNVFDYRRAGPGGAGFSFGQIDHDWQDWTAEQYRDALNHPLARAAYAADSNAIARCRALILVQPSGRSAHVEAGIAIGMGTHVLVLSDGTADLMLGGRNVQIFGGIFELIDGLRDLCERTRPPSIDEMRERGIEFSAEPGRDG